MHPSCRTFVELALAALPRRPLWVAELGSRNVNGGVRDLFPDALGYVGMDLSEGPGVDETGNAATWLPPWAPEAVVCLSVLEHAPEAAMIVENAHDMLVPGGVLILATVGPPWPPHGAAGGPVGEGEFYRGVEPRDLTAWLRPFRWATVATSPLGDRLAVAFRLARGEAEGPLELIPAPWTAGGRTADPGLGEGRDSAMPSNDPVQCADCQRVVYRRDVDKAGMCSFCRTEEPKPQEGQGGGQESPAAPGPPEGAEGPPAGPAGPQPAP